MPDFQAEEMPAQTCPSGARPEAFTGIRRFAYNLSAAGWTLLDSLLLTYYVVFLLPPQERIDQGMVQFVSDRYVLGGLTALGAIMLVGVAVALIGFFLMLRYREAHHG